jgi:hypothetical protein
MRYLSVRIAVALIACAACGEREPSRLELRRRKVKALAASIQKAGGTTELDVRGTDGEVLVISDNVCTMQALEMWAATIDTESFVMFECTGPLGPLRLNVVKVGSGAAPAAPPRGGVIEVTGEVVTAVDASVAPNSTAPARRPARGRIEVQSDDPDRYAFGLVGAFDDVVRNPGAVVARVKRLDAGVAEVAEAGTTTAEVTPVDAQRAAPAPRETPAEMSDEMIDGALSKVEAQILECGGAVSETGKVVFQLAILPAGSASAKIVSTPNEELGECVKRGVKSAVFPPAKMGRILRRSFTF